MKHNSIHYGGRFDGLSFYSKSVLSCVIYRRARVIYKEVYKRTGGVNNDGLIIYELQHREVTNTLMKRPVIQKAL